VKQGLFLAVKVAVSVLLIWWLLDRIDVAPIAARFGALAAGPPVLLIALALAAMALAAALLALRWRFVNRALGVPVSGRRALRLTLIGLFFSQTLPSTIGGDAARIWFLYRDGVRLARAASGVVLDRLCALAALLTLVALTLPALFRLIDDPAPRWSLPLLVLAGACGFAVLLALGGRAGVLFARWRAARALVVLGADARALVAARAEALRAFALALCIHALGVLAVWLLGRAVGAAIPLVYCAVLTPPVILVSMMPVSIAGWGVREGAMVVAFGFVGVPAADALAVSLLFGLVLVAIGAPGGVLWLAEAGGKASGKAGGNASGKAGAKAREKPRES